MSEAKTIEHQGFIDEIAEDRIKVRFIAESACASCHAKGVCTASDMENKELWVKRDQRSFKAGERVKIILTRADGNRAVLLAYVMPFLVFLVALLILTGTGTGELKAGLYSLSLLIPYYFLLFVFKERINKQFSFSIKRYE